MAGSIMDCNAKSNKSKETIVNKRPVQHQKENTTYTAVVKSGKIRSRDLQCTLKEKGHQDADGQAPYVSMCGKNATAEDSNSDFKILLLLDTSESFQPKAGGKTRIEMAKPSPPLFVSHKSNVDKLEFLMYKHKENNQIANTYTSIQ